MYYQNWCLTISSNAVEILSTGVNSELSKVKKMKKKRNSAHCVYHLQIPLKKDDSDFFSNFGLFSYAKVRDWS